MDSRGQSESENINDRVAGSCESEQTQVQSVEAGPNLAARLESFDRLEAMLVTPVHCMWLLEKG